MGKWLNLIGLTVEAERGLLKLMGSRGSTRVSGRILFEVFNLMESNYIALLFAEDFRGSRGEGLLMVAEATAPQTSFSPALGVHWNNSFLKNPIVRISALLSFEWHLRPWLIQTVLVLFVSGIGLDSCYHLLTLKFLQKVVVGVFIVERRNFRVRLRLATLFWQM
jgi:hypothetical protein